MKKIIFLGAIGLYVAVGIGNLIILSSTPLIATEPRWALVLLWPVYWWIGY